jgi:uncharacterized protein YjiK
LHRTAFLPIVLVFLLQPRSVPQPALSVMSRYDLSVRTPRTFLLPPGLREVSGLATTPDGRLFAHDDERAALMEIDCSHGTVHKMFSAGARTFRQDFEDLAIVGKDFFLVISDGELLRFREGDDGERVPVEKLSTGLTQSHNVEGLCYDAETRSLLLACKNPGPRIEKRMRAVFSFSLRTSTLNPRPRFLINVDSIARSLGIKAFNPSGIVRHPVTGSFFLLSAAEPALCELSRDGSILALSRLPRDLQPQPEGIAIGQDTCLWIASEGKERGRLTMYPWSGK